MKNMLDTSVWWNFIKMKIQDTVVFLPNLFHPFVLYTYIVVLTTLNSVRRLRALHVSC